MKQINLMLTNPNKFLIRSESTKLVVARGLAESVLCLERHYTPSARQYQDYGYGKPARGGVAALPSCSTPLHLLTLCCRRAASTHLSKPLQRARHLTRSVGSPPPHPLAAVATPRVFHGHRAARPLLQPPTPSLLHGQGSQQAATSPPHPHTGASSHPPLPPSHTAGQGPCSRLHAPMAACLRRVILRCLPWASTSRVRPPSATTPMSYIPIRAATAAEPSHAVASRTASAVLVTRAPQATLPHARQPRLLACAPITLSCHQVPAAHARPPRPPPTRAATTHRAWLPPPPPHLAKDVAAAGAQNCRMWNHRIRPSRPPCHSRDPYCRS